MAIIPHLLFYIADVKNMIPNTEIVPVGLRKLKDVGLWNVILEVDLGDTTYNFLEFSVEKMAQLIKKWLVWIHENLHKQAKVFVNFRDLPEVMLFNSERIFYIIDYLARLPSHLKLFGLLFEEPKGTSLPDEFGLMTKYIRKKMNANNWNGHLLIHVHEKFGFSDYTALEVRRQFR